MSYATWKYEDKGGRIREGEWGGKYQIRVLPFFSISLFIQYGL